MKVSFGRRLVSYIIDIIIVSALVSLICLAIPNKESNSETELENLSNKLISGEITTSKYITEYENILYEDQKADIIPNVVNVVLVIAYFVVFQYMNKGQTLGKKLLRIKVVDKDTNNPVSIYKGFLRSLLVVNIISSLMTVTIINLITKKIYINAYIGIAELESLLIFASAILILYRKDGRGLHDMVVNTIVVEEKR